MPPEPWGYELHVQPARAANGQFVEIPGRMSTNVAVVDELRLRAAEGRRLNLGRRIIVAGEDLNETERVLLQARRHADY
jgi:hypothetical protein